MSGLHWYLQIVRTTWVLWGYGPRKSSSTHVDRAIVRFGPDDWMTLEFELPRQASALPPPQEYERRVSYGWRWEHENGAGHSWCLAESIEDAVTTARGSMKHQRHDTQKLFEVAIQDIRITDE